MTRVSAGAGGSWKAGRFAALGTLRRGAIRAGAPVVAGLLLAWPRMAWGASFEEELADCEQKYTGTGSFDCSVCGVSAGCSGSDCHWGGLKASATDSAALGGMIGTGYQLYCLNRGGSMVASASPTGAQGANLARAFSDARQVGQQVQAGGVLEYASLTGDYSSYGVAIPVSWQRSFSMPSTDLDLAGSLLFGKSDLVTQYGFTAHPSLRYFPSADPGQKRVLGLSVPVALIVTSGDAIDTSLVYHAGLGTMAGFNFGDWGVGGAADAIYAQGIQLPFQIVGRFSTNVSGMPLAIQPGVSADAIALGGIMDTLQQNVLVGYDIGDWLLGLRVFRQGDDGWVFAAGASTSPRAAKLAAGTDEAYQRSKPAAGPKPGPGPLASPAETLDVLVAADVSGDVSESAKLRAAVRAVFEGKGIKPLDAAATDQATAAFGGAPADITTLDAARGMGHAKMAVSVRATPTAAGSMQVVLLVTGRGVTAERWLVAEPDQLSAVVQQAIGELLLTLDLRGLGESPMPPAPPPFAPPTSTPPSTPEPPPEGTAPSPPPDATPPSVGCAKDTDCKGDRICVEGRCQSPP